MRSTTQKLSLAFVALLLAHCALPSDSESTGTDEGAATVGDDDAAGLQGLRATDTAPRARTSDPAADALAYLSSAAGKAGVAAPQFKVTNVASDVDGLTHVRAQQMYQGLVVFGADAVVHLSSAAVIGATGNIATQLDGVSTSTTLAPNEMLTKAKADRYGARGVVTERETVERIVHVNAKGEAHVAFHTSYFNELQGDVQPALWHHVYDAQTGKLLARWNQLETVEQASGAGGNPKWVHSWNGELDVTAQGTGYVMTTATLKTTNLNHAQSGGAEVTGALDAIGDAPINDAHGFAEITLKVLNEWMGRNSIDDRGFRIPSRVHYGTNYENAFWDGQQMTYGDGASRFYPLSGGLDVVAHEIHHGFTTFHSNLRYSGQSGGLNEGFSDIAGKTAEFFYKPAANWDLGGDVFKQAGAALRYMCDPKKDGRSIDNAANMTASLDPHYSSGVPNKSFCLASKRISTGGDPAGVATRDGVKRAATAYYLANAQYWTASTTFIQACQGIADAARALNYTADEVGWLKASWADVGVTCN